MKISRVLRQNNTYSLLRSHKMSIAVTLKQANTSCSLSPTVCMDQTAKVNLLFDYSQLPIIRNDHRLDNPRKLKILVKTKGTKLTV